MADADAAPDFEKYLRAFQVRLWQQLGADKINSLWPFFFLQKKYIFSLSLPPFSCETQEALERSGGRTHTARSQSERPV